jgi:copper resistance protein C
MRAMKILVATAILLLAITPAFAHAHLVETVPANASVVASSPVSLTLKFSEGVELGFTGLTLTGPSGIVALGPAQLDPSDDTRFIVPVPSVLVAGTYVIAWHALSTDGHKTMGSYAFTIK